ncbi:MAG: histidine kinase dimerization/phospho-acceptor domain-containing protein, partial [Opitutales bacterium]
TAIKAVNLGAHGYLTKPCSFHKLKNVLTEAYARYEAEEKRLAEFRQRLLTMHDNFFSVLCHEVNTPLNGIIGFASILKEELEDQERSNMAGMIEDAASDLHATFMEILDYISSKVRSVHLAAEVFSPKDLAQKFDASRYAGKVDYEFVGDFWQSSEHFIGPLDSLLAILGNAVLAGLNGKASCVRIHGSLAKEQMTLRLSNLDLESRFGSREDLDSIFSPYTISQTTRSRFDPGVGLRLATSRNLAEVEGVRLEAKKSLDGNIEIHISVALPKADHN